MNLFPLINAGQTILVGCLVLDQGILRMNAYRLERVFCKLWVRSYERLPELFHLPEPDTQVNQICRQSESQGNPTYRTRLRWFLDSGTLLPSPIFAIFCCAFGFTCCS